MGSSVLDETPLLAAVRALGLGELARSSEGRPIWGGAIGAGPSPLLLIGGVHGDEPSSVEAVVALVGRLRAHAAAAAPLIVVPALNPDGLARNAKNSARDVDLNRNFPARNWT